MSGLIANAYSSPLAQELINIRANWTAMSPAQRLQSVDQAMQRNLVNNGFPAIPLSTGSFSGNKLGEFDPEGAVVYLHEGFFNDPPISDAAFIKLAEVMVHEVRHFEQSFVIVQLLASEGWSAQDIFNHTQINKNTVALGMDAQRARPLSPAEVQAIVPIYDSMYGQGRAYRDQVLAMPTSPSQEQAARSFPEEKDAYGVSDNFRVLMEGLMRGRSRFEEPNRSDSVAFDVTPAQFEEVRASLMQEVGLASPPNDFQTIEYILLLNNNDQEMALAFAKVSPSALSTPDPDVVANQLVKDAMEENNALTAHSKTSALQQDYDLAA